jgi:hypothetical protein
MSNSDEDSTTIASQISDMRELSKNASNADVRPSDDIEAKKRQKVATTSMRMEKTSSAGGFGGLGGAGTDIAQGGATNIYSPHLSSDFLELPQNLTEQRSYYRHFYNNDPYVGQAIDLHTELPLSKIRLDAPKGSDTDRNRKIKRFFEDMCDRIGLLDMLKEATREYYVIGEAFIFAEDSEVELPEEYEEAIRYKTERWIDPETHECKERKVERENADELIEKYKRENYRGWENLVLLPPDQVNIESFQFSDESKIELVPDGETKNMVQKAMSGHDPEASEMVLKIPREVREYIQNGENIPLGTDPDEGSFVYQLARKKSSYQTHGTSLLQRCMRTLVYRDKLRQAQTSIASRAMTPKRVVYAEDLSEPQVEELRDQVDQALLDPDFSVITNYQVNWEEVGSSDRLLNLSSEYDMIKDRLFAGLGVTRSMLTGESSYSGQRINLEVINTRYLLYRETVQHFVEEKLFKPVAKKKGFYEYDEYGNRRLLYPRLSFTRLAVRDNRDTFDNLFNLYQKGSLSISYILELFNLDPDIVRERVEQDMFTVSDATFNEAVRGILSEAGREVVEKSNFIEIFVEYLSKHSQFDHLEYEPPDDDDGGRF